MEMIHLRPQDYVTTEWSGGTTTQLRIFPEGSVYADRDFLWRISSATVSVKESDFTSLPDYHRLISVLKGDMTLSHNGGEPFTLCPYEIHEFEGSDNTHSWGECTDFNLMLRRGRVDGTAEALHLAGERKSYTSHPQTEEMILYCAEGSCTITCQGKILVIIPREALLIHQAGNAELTLETEEETHLMICQMWQV